MSEDLQPKIDATLQRKARQEYERRLASERGRYYEPNGGIERFLKMIAAGIPKLDGRIFIVKVRAGNGVGKTALAANLAAYLTNEYINKYFDAVPVLKSYRRPNRGRIVTTATAAQSAYDEELGKWLPHGAYTPNKNGHKFKQHYKMSGNGSEFDILTFDQDPAQAESVTLDWAIVDEPMPYRHYTALRSRFRFGGIIFMLYTALEGSGWYEQVLEDPERLGRDVFVMELSSEENCITHGIRGILPHAALESQWADFEESELAARRDGKFIHQGGAIYPTFVDDEGGHIRRNLPPFHQECWDKKRFTLWQIIDPHDRKPWAISWRAFFPNGQSFAVAEWPDDSMRPFHKIKSWNWGWNQYAQLTVETEKQLGVKAFATIMDPNYGPSAALTADGVTSFGAEFQKACRALTGVQRRMIFPSDEISSGHLAVKGELGDPRNKITPNYYWLEHCKNGRFGMRHYGFKENRDEKKGLSEMPMLQFKDFPDLERYCVKAKARYLDVTEELPDDVVFYAPPVMGNGRVGV